MTERPESAIVSAALLAAIVESTEVAIFSTDRLGVVTSWSTGAHRLYGYDATEALGQSDHLIIPPDRLAEADEIRRRVVEGHVVSSLETVRTRKDGERIDVSLTASPVRQSDGSVVGVAEVNRDITT